jgi:collagenase-like PrtC family protease
MDNDELTGQGYRRVKDFFKMLREIGVSSITVALPSLMEIAMYVIPGVKIKASAVCQINSPLKAKFYDKLGVKRLVLDEDIYRRFDILGNIRKVYTGELEVIVNSFCSNDCPYKMFHYNSFSHAHLEKELYGYYAGRCRSMHIGEESFMKLNWIRPEDIQFYHQAGIDYFKIQGRTNVYTGDPAKAAIHYIEGSYDGDLVRLLELFSSKRPLAIAESYVDNRKLDGFLNKFVKEPDSCTKVCDECNYCKSYGEASIGQTDRAIMDIMKTMDSMFLKEFPGVLDN